MNFASDETERGTKSAIIVSNATDRTVFVEMEAIETVRKGNTQALDLGIGVNAGTTNFAGTTVEVRLDQGVEGAWSKVFSFSRPSRCCLRKSCWTRERRRCTLTPPGTSLFQVVATIQGLGDRHCHRFQLLVDEATEGGSSSQLTLCQVEESLVENYKRNHRLKRVYVK